jgi:hypothetical protein
MDAGSILFAAAAAVGTKAVEEPTKLLIADLWSALKAAIKRKRGEGGDALEVIGEVERLPANATPSAMLGQRVQALRLPDDPDIAAVLQRIEALLNERTSLLKEGSKTYVFQNNTFTGTSFS